MNTLLMFDTCDKIFKDKNKTKMLKIPTDAFNKLLDEIMPLDVDRE